jgi:hypothetical protein
MSHPAIPAPLRFDGGEGQFALRSGTTIAYTTTEVAPLVERFCSKERKPKLSAEWFREAARQNAVV